MKIIFDTDVLLDLLLMRKPHYQSVAKLVSLIEYKIIEGWLCPNTVSTVQYLLTEALDKKQAATHINSIMKLYHISDLNQKILNDARVSGSSDYEQALIYQTALQTEMDGILTRNKDPYSAGTLPVFNPQKLLALFNSLEV